MTNSLLSYFIDNALTFLLTAPIVIIALTMHEASHAFVAYKLGDPTAKRYGRLTLNPLRHMDPLGAVCMFFFGVGWAKPVPIDCRYFKNPKRGMALSAAAGPCMNLALSVIGGFLYCLCLALMRIPLFSISVLPFSFMIRLLAQFFYLFHILNLSLAVFNLLPIPPFDGSRVLFAFLPDKYYFGIMRYERYIQIVLLVLIYFGFADGFLSAVTAPLSNLILRLFKLLFRIPLS